MSTNIKAVKKEFNKKPDIYVKVNVTDTYGIVYFADDDANGKGTTWDRKKAEVVSNIDIKIARDFKEALPGYDVTIFSEAPLPQKEIKATFGSYIETDYSGTGYDMEIIIILSTYYSLETYYPDEITLFRRAHLLINKINEDGKRDTISKYPYPLSTVSKTFEYVYDSQSNAQFLSDMLDLALEIDGKDPVKLVDDSVNPPKLQDLINELPPEVLDDDFIFETKKGIDKFLMEVENFKE